MSGTSLASLLRFLIHSANQDTFPSIPSLFSSWVTNLTTISHQDSIELFKQQLQQLLLWIEPPSEEDFQTRLDLFYQEACAYFKDLLFGFETLYQPGLDKLTAELKEKKDYYQQRNRERIREVILGYQVRVLEEIRNRFESKIELPVHSQVLKQFAEKVNTDVVGEYHAKLGKYANSSYFNEYLSNVQVIPYPFSIYHIYVHLYRCIFHNIHI